ncbi:MAG: hypothetical protein NZ699_19625 [Roseiflexus sp.]|nr:hypothetical protein [Roseiflexus sp.]MCS7291332.1 hypothetical protein [Roseiflexus sp.]MDW8146622.1 hypothetical protein [Roseiflexaceae bacterium]MDW8232915.1 hypothetical protein [Roseiflexaceae bacterium]
MPLPLDEPAPHTLLPIVGAVAWPPTLLPTPVRSYRTLSPLT